MKKHHAMIARSGIQYYMDSELPGLMLNEIPREYRGQRVFSVYRPSFVLENAKEKFAQAPIRVEHKWVYNESDPAIIGHICDDVKIKKLKEEVGLYSSIDIDDENNLPSFKELSPGYISENRWQAGVAPNGEPYEILCTGIKSINHLAIVQEARGGKDMKILDGGKRLMVHSGLIHAVKKRLLGVFDGKPEQTFESTVDEIASTLQNISDEELKAKTASLVGSCDNLPDSEEKEKLLRYIADIPLLKDEEGAVAEEALKCIKESYKSLDSDAVSEVMEKPMEEEKKEEVSVQSDALPVAEQGNGAAEEVAEEKKEDGCGDPMAKIADSLDALSKKFDSLLESLGNAKKEEVADEAKEEVKEEVKEEKKEEGVTDSLPRYTQSLETVEKGYSLDDAFNKLAGRR